MYDNPKDTIALFAEFNKFSLSVAEAGFKFFPKHSLALAPVSRVDFSIDLALKLTRWAGLDAAAGGIAQRL